MRNASTGLFEHSNIFPEFTNYQRLFVNDELMFESVPNGGAASPNEYEIAAPLRSGYPTRLTLGLRGKKHN